MDQDPGTQGMMRRMMRMKLTVTILMGITLMERVTLAQTVVAYTGTVGIMHLNVQAKGFYGFD